MNLEKLQPSKAATIVICCSVCFLTILSIFLLNRPLFFQLNLWQLLGVSLGISCPILFCSSIIGAFVFLKKNDDERDEETQQSDFWGYAGIIGIIQVTVALVGGYAFHFSLKELYFILFFSNLILVPYSLWRLIIRLTATAVKGILDDAINKAKQKENLNN